MIFPMKCFFGYTLLCLMKKYASCFCASPRSEKLFLQNSSCQYLIVVNTFQLDLFGRLRRNPSKPVEKPKKTSKNQKIRRNPSTAFCEHFFSFSESFQRINQRICIFVSGCSQNHKNTSMVLCLEDFWR